MNQTLLIKSKFFYMNQIKTIIILFLLAFSPYLFGQGTIQIGSGTSTNTNFPIYTCYGYSYTQQIYLGSEYLGGGGAAGNITKIRFYYASGGTTFTNWNNWTVYIGHTSKTSFASTTDWVPLANMTQVFSGTVNPVGNSWMEITLTTPFNYNGTSNLVVAVDENAAGYSCTAAWNSFVSSGTRGLLYYSDSNNPDPNSPPTANTSSATISQVQFEGQLASCLPPSNITATGVTQTSATINWSAPSPAPSLGYEYIVNTSNTPPTGNGTPVTGTSVNVSGLSPSTMYHAWVRSVCSSVDKSYWNSVVFYTTPANDDCANAINVPVNAGNTCIQSVNGTTNGATQSTGETAPTCSATAIDDDVWYKFTATSTAHLVNLISNDNAAAMQLYSGSCGGLTAMMCATTTYNNAHFDLTGLTVGATYYLRLYSTSTTGVRFSFNLCITTKTGIAPTNDLCAGAIALTCDSPYSGNNTEATTDVLPTTTCGSTGANFHGVWFTVVPNSSGPLTIDGCGAKFDAYLRVYTGSCASLTACSGSADAGCSSTLFNAPSVTIANAIAGTTYYILLTSYSATQYGEYTINAVCAKVCTGAPSNLTASGVTDNAATISWTAATPAPANGYQYYYSTSSTPPTASTIPNGSTTNTSVTLTGLNFNTTYYVWVRSYCFSGDYSNWVALPTFTTLPPSNCSTSTSATPNPTCTGTTITLNTSGSWVSYAWSGPAGFTSNAPSPTIPNAQPANSGQYTVTVVDVNMCTTVGTVNVTVNPLPVVTIGATPNPICVGKTLQLSAAGGNTYSWSGPGAFTSNIQNPTRTNIQLAHGGIYTVTVTSAAGCTSTKTINVTVNALPTAYAGVSPNPVCQGELAWFESKGGVSYKWSGPNGFTTTQQNFGRHMELNMAGVYTVTVTSSAGCTATASVSVSVTPTTPATASVTPNPACSGSTVQLSATGGGTYAWKGPNNFTSNLQNPVITNVQTYHAGTYYVYVTSGNCQSSAEVTLEVKQTPAGKIGYDANSLCNGDTLKLYSSGGVSYAWSGPGGWTSNVQNPTRPNANSSMSGTYSVTITGLSGCTAVLSTSVTIRNKPVATAWTTTPEVCEGSTAYLFASGGVNYSWSGPYSYASNMQNPVITGIPSYMSGRYTVTVSNEYGCNSTATVNITVQSVNGQANATPNPVPYGGTLYLTASGGTMYLWTGPNGFNTTTQNPIIYNFNKNNIGVYTVIISTSAGCSDTKMILVNIQGGVFGGSQNQIAEGTYKQVYPNPANSLIKIEDEYTGEIEYTIFNTMGEISGKGKTISGQNIQIDQLSSGTYYIQWHYTKDGNQVNNISSFVKSN